MKSKILGACLFLTVSGQAYADATMQTLQTTAQALADHLALSNNIAWSIDGAAHSGQIVSTGTVDPALIDQAAMDAYNSAIDGVLNASYLTAQDVFQQEHQTAINNMHTAIDDLVQATSVLATVVTVADMAGNADTTQEQLQVQAALQQTDMTITQAEVDNYNSALTAVESYAQQAGAFLAASSNTNITSAVDSYAAANNVAVASYTAVSYAQDVDRLIVEFGASAYLEFNGAFTAETLATTDIWAQVGYGG